MKSRNVRSVFHALAYAAVAFTGLVLAGPQASAKMMDCYNAADDQDNDGYARTGAVSLRVRADDSALNCPTPYLTKADDCNDFNGAVHPRTREIGYDGMDNNCNGLIDEPTADYRADGINNHARNFSMFVHLNNTRIRDVARAGRLWVKVKYFRLYKSNAVGERLIFVSSQRLTPGGNVAEFDLVQLEPGTVYCARAYFYELPAGTLELVRISPAHNPAAAATDIGNYDMERYYTMTDSDVASIHKRFLIVMRALNETESSNWGEVGYRGTARDGTRYQASGNEKWCSEFYVWAIHPWVVGLNDVHNLSDLLEYWFTGSAPTDTVADLLDYFDAHNAKYNASEMVTALPGDYLALDSDQNGSINHSAMFLAYDTSGAAPILWTLEGNSGNTVRVRNDRSPDLTVDRPVVRKVGKIRSGMWL